MFLVNFVQLSPKQLRKKYEQRRECALQIRALHCYFDWTSPSVFAAAIAVMDSALMKLTVSVMTLTVPQSVLSLLLLVLLLLRSILQLTVSVMPLTCQSVLSLLLLQQY